VPAIIPVVEGQGEVAAVPVLLRRLLGDRDALDIGVAKPVNAHGFGGLTKRLEHFLELTHWRPGCGAILVLQDGEGGCPAAMAREYSRRTTEAGCKHPVAVVIANRMYESWLIASLPTTLPGAAPYEGDPEAVSSKAWLDSRMRPDRAYREVAHQPSMTSRLDPALARRCRSFRRLEAALDFLIECIRTGTTGISPPP